MVDAGMFLAIEFQPVARRPYQLVRYLVHVYCTVPCTGRWSVEYLANGESVAILDCACARVVDPIDVSDRRCERTSGSSSTMMMRDAMR